LIQTLRGYRRPVSGATLASELGVSIRTLYRDIDTLKAQGAHIEGAAGLGFVLRPGFMLPPLMISEHEIEALVLGSRWVAERADHELATGARRALSKIAAVLPSDLRPLLEDAGLIIGPAATVPAGDGEIASPAPLGPSNITMKIRPVSSGRSVARLKAVKLRTTRMPLQLIP
jgi:predicted DNA-binding transcriptional regulator YafY